MPHQQQPEGLPVIVTTSRDPSPGTRRFARALASFLSLSYVNRGKSGMGGGEEEEAEAALVVVDVHDPSFFQSRVDQEAASLLQLKSAALEKDYQARLEKETGEARRKLLFSLETRYRIRNDQFLIQKAVDDGIFTYVLMPYAQERPAVFVAERDKEKELQPVKYVDLGEYYQIHRVLSAGEKFFLKSGDKTTEIGRE